VASADPCSLRTGTSPELTRSRRVQKRTDISGVELLLSIASKRETVVPTTLLVVLVILWAFGVASATTLGGLIHLLLVVAILIVLVRVIQGRHPLRG